MIKKNDVSVCLKENLKTHMIYKRPNGMNCIHENEVNILAEYNLLDDILNPSKCNPNSNIHSSPIIHVCMNTRKDRAKFKNFQILLDSGYSSTILMIGLIQNLTLKKTMWYNGTHKWVILLPI